MREEKRGRTAERVVEYPVQEQTPIPLDGVTSGRERHRPGVESDDHARLNRSVHGVRVLTGGCEGEVVTAVASGARRELEGALSIGEGDRMRHLVLVDPEEIPTAHCQIQDAG